MAMNHARGFWRWVIGVFLLVSIGLPVRAWDPDGHQIVATIAYDQLNPKAKAEAQALAAQVAGPNGAYDPITIACWMDDLRGKHPDLPYHGLFFPWHYIDFGLEPNDPKPPLEPGQDNETSGNIITALKRALVVLKGGTDPYIKSKAMAYAMAVHLVGDIHQPLHAGAYYELEPDGRWKNDAGGNRVAVVNGPAIEPKYNLHYFWDAAWRASFDQASGLIVVDLKYENWDHHRAEVVKPLAEELEVSDKPAASVSLEPDFLAWAEESNKIAREEVYPKLTFTENHKQARISAEYVAMANPLARQRIVLAGYRLATLLNETLGAATLGPIPPSYPAGPPATILPDANVAPPKK
jgi:hypothetical protein